MIINQLVPGFSTLALLTFWMDNSLFWGAVLRCLAADAATHQMPVAPPTSSCEKK